MDRVEHKGSVNMCIRRSYNATFKIKVIQEAESSNNCAAARKFGITENNVRRWRKQKEELQKANSSRKAFRGPKVGRQKEVEEQICQYVLKVRNEGLPVSTTNIILKSKEIARKLDISQESFKASYGWCRRMMRRNGFSLRRRTSLAQKLPQEFEEKLMEFQRYIINLRKKHIYPLSLICNADQTPVFFDMPATTTVNPVGSKSITIKTTGNEKSRITVMLGVLADGEKLPPYVIFKRKTMPKETFPPGIIVRVDEKGWMNENLVVDWISTVWQRHVGLRKPRAMLVLDAYRGHLTNKVKKKIASLHTDLVIIPGGMTSQLQVLDVSVNKPFKGHLKSLYNEWMISAVHCFTPKGKIKKPSARIICEWISTAWNRISNESIIAGFKKCCISNNLDGTDDDLLWENEVDPHNETETDSSSSEFLSDEESN